jgi:hypothetical protein
MVHGVTLEAAYGDWLFVESMEDTRAFAQHIDRADARTTEAQDVGIHNGGGGAGEISSSDLLDEARNVDVGGASRGARRIEAEEAAVRLGERSLCAKGRV